MLISQGGFDRAALRRLVEAFYQDARKDPLLGPVFDRHVSDWEAHLVRMTDFWSSVTMRDGSYAGHPLELHRAIPELTRPMFERWVEVFGSAARRELGETAATRVIVDHARRMGMQMSRGVPATAITGSSPH